MKRFLTVFFLYSLTISGVTDADELVSFELVRQSFGSVEARMPYAASTSVRTGDRLELSTSDGYNFGLKISSTALSSHGNRIIRGSTDGQGTALLVVTPEGAVLGSVEELGQKFRVNTDGSGSTQVHILYPSNNLGTIDEQPSAPPPTKPELMGLDIDAASLKTGPLTMLKAERSVGVGYPVYKTGTAEISVLIYYDQRLNNPTSVIDYVMDYSNQAFIQSGVDIRLALVGTKAISLGSDFNRPLANKMYESQPPFENIAEDRRFYEADIVVTIKSGYDPDNEFCGFAPFIGVYKSRPYRNSYVAVASWQPDTYYDYCEEATFTHEIGHLLGGMHLKADYSAPIVGAYSYSHGHQVVGALATLMVPYSTGINRIQQFSSPNASCSGYSCGVVGQSDMVDTFNSTGHIISGFEGSGFSYELVNAQRVDEQDSECEKDGLSGYWEAHGTNNQSKYGLELASVHFVRTNGTSFVAEYNRGDRIISPNRLAWRGWCVTAENPSGLRTEYVESFTRFYNPLTDEIVQSESLFWDENYTGEYSSIRIATGQGGSVSGNTAHSVRIGSSKTFTFTPDVGYEAAGIHSNCSGQKIGNRYRVDVGQDDCFVEASFNQVAVGETLRVSVETPAEGQVYSGIGNFQGWAVAQEGIDRVDLYVDGVFFQSAPYGGARGDVGNVFPDVPSSNNSGFSLAYNYGNLSEGEHTLRAVAVTKNGRTLERSTAFSVTKFHKDFIGPQDAVSLNGASCEVQGSQMSVVDALIDGKSYDISLEWRTGTQGFEIYKIR